MNVLWNGMCPAGEHGLDFKGQTCDLCAVVPAGPTCQHCASKPCTRVGDYVSPTCGASACQEAEYQANRERNAAKRRRK